MKSYKTRYLVTAILLMQSLISNVSGNEGQSTTYDFAADPGRNYDVAEFRSWIPESPAPFQAVLVLVSGWNWDGRPAINDSVWQSFATDHNLALVACYFKDKPSTTQVPEVYCNVSLGSGQALLDALNDFANQSNHPEIASAPLLLWGMSAGGQFNYEFTAWKPDRVIAFIVNKGGFYHSALLGPQARNVPGLLFTGEKDQEFRQDIIKGLFATNNRAGALWAFIEEPNTGHETGRSRELALVFFDDMLRLRLAGKDQETNGRAELLPLSPESGYLGDLESKTYSKIDKGAKAPDRPTAWLATEQIALMWQKIMLGNP